MLKSLISKGLTVPHRCENRYIYCSAFERMEAKFMQLESSSQAIGELSPSDMERVFVGLEASSDVEDELALLKAQMLLGNTAHPLTVRDSAVDAELEQLRSKLKEM